MAHPRMFDDDDPLLARVRDLALALPEAKEKISHGHPAFHTVKVFAYFGGSERTGGQWTSHPRALLVLPDPDERDALLADERFFAPAYLGPYGWVGFGLPRPSAARKYWDEVAELVDESYRNTAHKRLVALLDGRESG